VKAFIDDGNGHVSGVKTVLVKWSKDADGRWKFSELPGLSLASIAVVFNVCVKILKCPVYFFMKVLTC